MPDAKDDSIQAQQGSSVYAALARTTTRSIALYFSRPVRLFRPSKVTGWQTLKSLAIQEGVTLSPKYIYRLVREQGFMVIPKHFIPPMVVNAILGTVLWASYAEASLLLESRLQGHPLISTALSGGIAGGMQAVVAAPVENVRLVLEGGSSAGSWGHAWKEVFRGTHSQTSQISKKKIQDARMYRHWMREVKGMAGRGWDGWGWGCAKDICGFSVFFSIFEATRGVAANVRKTCQRTIEALRSVDGDASVVRHAPRLVHATTLVSGGILAGISYELVCRPFDVARKAVYVEKIAAVRGHRPAAYIHALLMKVQEDGPISLFRDPSLLRATRSHSGPSSRKRVEAMLRILARAGPWGIGFLVWEAFGPGIS
ncbi:hypothetical protein GLOTRDRAFT_37305 [Gloeophyllum trabeum ATCC 11539]|uniref:Mitochondrial carrier n=1 Tax=Gloeophyllum trabeum (strain ATCC 11539 / FP-39264 / Madison 617) TaxID=670483 RepID=S7QG31_GLOTA|nr:uncharacterized protein GLOTRDRAFT_37305 [Gloeophyllum trabeum ATCC 11539]EPQ58382.1 hypothetical protein GLOTRDRAFT_37305 [Gloeophyllum trabeum ATCC 11539]